MEEMNVQIKQFLCAKLVSTIHPVQSSNFVQIMVGVETKSFPVQINLPLINNSHIFLEIRTRNNQISHIVKFEKVHLSFA